MEQALEHLPGAIEYSQMRREVEETLVAEIRAAMKPSPTQLHLLSGYNPRLSNVADAFSVTVYGKNPRQVAELVQAARDATPTTHQLHAAARLGMGLPASQSELEEIVQAAQQGGADLLLFYNYSESPRTMLDWIKPALSVLPATTEAPMQSHRKDGR
jgi:hypothetical protein